MRAGIVFLWVFTVLLRTGVKALAGGSQLAHNYEAMYFYCGYLVDVALNGDSRTLGPKCKPSTGTVCTFWEFIKSIMSEFNAASLEDGGELGDTTRLGDDLQELAQEMTNWGYTDYVPDRLANDGEIRHSILLLKVTNLLISARDSHQTVLEGGLLTQAKKALVYIQAESEQGTLASKKQAIKTAWDGTVTVAEKTVSLEEELITFQDIDWEQTAKSIALAGNAKESDVSASVTDFARHMSQDSDVDIVLRRHLLILQSIRTQSDSLGTLAACRAL